MAVDPEKIMESEEYRSSGGKFLSSPWDVEWNDIPYHERETQTLPPPLLRRELETILREGRPSERSAVYIHIPFCRLDCTYCGFYKQKADDAKLAAYAESLIKEIQGLRSCPLVEKSKVAAVFFGGGTPGLLSPAQITAVMAAVEDTFHPASGAEITMESSLSDMTEEKMEAAVASGVNRFSFGVQSFDTRVRHAVGRPDPKEKAAESIRRYAGLGADVIIDLIYGLEHQTEETMRKDIRQAVSCGVAGLDLYKLQIHPHSVLGKAFAATGRKLDNSRLQTLFRATVEELETAGAKGISCTHWKMKETERSLYNTISSEGGDVFALGMACGGTLGGISFFKTVKEEIYRKEARHGYAPAMGKRKSPYAARLGCISSACDRGVLDLHLLEEETDIPLQRLFAPVLAAWEKWGLLYREDGRYLYGPAGKYWYKTMRRYLLRMTENLLYGMEGAAAAPKKMNWQGMDNLK